MMIDHIGFPVRNYEEAKEFYTKALAPLGYILVMEAAPEHTISGKRAAGFGFSGKPAFWIGESEQSATGLHICVSAKSSAEVDAFHAAALSAGGKDNGAPGIRAHYHPNYYGAFVFDLDGNNVEAVFHGGADPRASH